MFGEEYSRGDCIRLYLTGAASDGGAQTDPDASLGGYRSSTEIPGLGVVVSNPIPGITINYVSHNNGAGLGSLRAVTADSLAWTPPNGTEGIAIEIDLDETKLIEGGSGEYSKFIRVTRTQGVSLAGTSTLTLTIPEENVLAMDDSDSDESGAGSSKYRCIAIKNESDYDLANVYAYIKEINSSWQTSRTTYLPASGAGTITLAGSNNFNLWPLSGYCRIETSAGALKEIVYYSTRTNNSLTVPSTGRGLLGTSASQGTTSDKIYCVPGIKIAGETATGGDHAQTIANEDTSPTGRTWKTGRLSDSNGVSVGTLASGALYFIWICRQIPEGYKSSESIINQIELSFDSMD